MKIIKRQITMLLLCSLLLTGCISTNLENSEVAEEVVDVQKRQDTLSINLVETENPNDTVKIGDRHFIEKMDKIFSDLTAYEGKTLTYEGFVAATGEDGEGYAVVRNYELNHGDHSHMIHVGMEVLYSREWPKLDSWVQVTGKIERHNVGGEDYPVLQAEELTILSQRGQDTVID